MITASHNPVEDNGVKLMDSTGAVLEQKWEKEVERLVNSDDFYEECEDFLLMNGLAVSPS